MTTETVFAPAARRDLQRLDPLAAQRILRAVRRYAETGYGDVRRLSEGEGEARLHVGDWRVRLRERREQRQAPAAIGPVAVRCVEVLRIIPTGIGR